jgi:hypothetical protein
MIENLPTYFEVKIGNSKFDMMTESLITTLCHQYLNKYQNIYNFDQYEVIFHSVKIEIEKYVFNLAENNIKEIDILGNWAEKFQEFQQDKNQHLCKDFVVEFSDNSKWSVKLLDLLSLKYNDQDIDDDDPFIKNEKLILNWAKTLIWSDLEMYAEEIQRPQPEPDYAKEFKRAKKEIVSWEKTINLLDLLEASNEEDEDDRPI